MDTAIGYLMAFMAGVLFGASDTLVRAAAVGLKPTQNLLISLVVGAPILWGVAFATGGGVPSGKPLLLYVIAGLLNFILGRLLFYIAVTYSGATTAAIVTSPTSAVAAAMAWLALGESLSPAQVTGVIMVVVAVYLTYARPSGEPLQGGRASVGILAGLASTVVFATTAILVRNASGYLGGDPVSGVAVSYTVAIPFAAAMNIAGRDAGKDWPRRQVAIMALAAAVVAMAQLSRYTALSLIRVANASVLMALFPLHTLAFTLMLGGDLREKPGMRHAVAAVLAALGVALVNGLS